MAEEIQLALILIIIIIKKWEKYLMQRQKIWLNIT
jgi:hypothetical protein